jgi:hypothetical protein
MPVPATTGQSRARVKDMQIGDYLSAAIGGATANGLGSVRADVSFGDATNPNYNFPEIPLTGLTGAAGSTTGYFYFVKVNKGLLIADRVVQNGISWDVLNTGKVIQGLPWDLGNIIPTMTSNTTPSGVASASSSVNSDYGAWKAFDKIYNNGNSDVWMSAATAYGWLSYQFSSPVIIRKYTISNLSSVESGAYATRSPKDWTFEGSSDGVSWNILDSQQNQTGWTSAQKRAFTINKPNSYAYYRLNITANNGETYIAISEVEMMETAGIIRSLTGGVAYVDANGNEVLNLPSPQYGAWPINNEWDKYIVSSNLGGKITAGDNNVWHWNNQPYNWTQDSPSISLDGSAATSTQRIVRGRTPLNNTGYLASNTVSAVCGFRPVFAYQE